MIDLFPAADAIVSAMEGFHNVDQGGDTWYGIARRFHPEETPWPPTESRAADIRRTQYWDFHHCGQMPWAWALAVYDGAINQGSAPIVLAQRALGVSADGSVGPGTLAAMATAGSEQFEIFLAAREIAYAGDGDFSTDGKGWYKRCIHIAMQAAVPPAS